MQQNILCISSKRSTHHAFLRVILDGQYYRYGNDILTKRDGRHFYYAPAKIYKNYREVNDNGPLYDIHLISMERFKPSKANIPDLIHDQEIRKLFSNKQCKSTNIVYLRDGLNTVASLYSVYKSEVFHKDSDYIPHQIQYWTHLVQSLISTHSEEFVFCYANDFWKDEGYQSGIVEKIGFTENIKVPQTNISFADAGHTLFPDRNNFEHKDLYNRYLYYIDDPEFIGILRDTPDFFEACINFADFCKDIDIYKILLNEIQTRF